MASKRRRSAGRPAGSPRPVEAPRPPAPADEPSGPDPAPVASAGSTAEPLSAARRRWFTALALLLPFVLLGLVELGLRAAGVGKDLPLFVEGPPGYRMENREVAGRYFYRTQNLPTPLYDVMAAEKTPKTLRLVVLGESSAAGFPFYFGAAFSRQLQDRLQQTFPDRQVEVFNTAMAAISSYALRDVTDEVLAAKPDAVLVYAGHNEYYGALGVGSAETIGRSPALVSLYLRLQRFRLVQALRGVLGRVAGLGRAPAATDGTLMERMVGEQRIPYGSALDRAGDRQFEANLSAVLATCRAAGVPVYVGTLASNERGMPPFLTHGGGAFAEQVAAAEVRVAADPAGARAALDVLVARDTLDARARFALGQARLALGDSAGARAAFLAAKDRDELKFRAPERFNALIRRLAAQHGATVVETQAALANASPHGIVGPELMTEHLHPTPHGYFLIADAFYEALRATKAFGPWTTVVPKDRAYARMALTPVDSLVGEYRLLQLRGSWPFQPPGTVQRLTDTVRARSEEQALALRLFRGEATWQATNAAARELYVRTGRTNDAVRAARAAIAEAPYSPVPYLDAANALVAAQRFDEALPYLRTSVAKAPSSAAEGLLGSLLLARGDRAGAVVHLQRAVALDGANAQALYNLAGAYALDGRYADAAPLLRQVLARDPNRTDARGLLAQIEPRLR